MKRKAIYTVTPRNHNAILKVPVTVIDEKKIFNRHQYRLETFKGELWVTSTKIEFVEE